MNTTIRKIHQTTSTSSNLKDAWFLLDMSSASTPIQQPLSSENRATFVFSGRDVSHNLVSELTSKLPGTTQDIFARKGNRVDSVQHNLMPGLVSKLPGTTQDIFIRKGNRVDSFLKSMISQSTKEGFPDPKVVSNANLIWRDAQGIYGPLLEEPLASLGADGGILFTWKKGPHYMEIEIVPDEIEVFYENEEINVVHYKSFPKYSLVIVKSSSRYLNRTAIRSTI